MDKNILINHITKIFNMNRDELNEQAMVISMSDVDDKARYFLNKAIDMRKEEIAQAGTPLIVYGDFDIEALEG